MITDGYNVRGVASLDDEIDQAQLGRRWICGGAVTWR